MLTARKLLEQYVASGKLMQLATLRQDGFPVACNVWYDFRFAPDVLRFISRHDRVHSENIRNDGRVAGSVIAVQLEGLGQVARGVTYTGTARELPTQGVDEQVSSFLARWPASVDAIGRGKLTRGETVSRLYEVSVDEWVLFDEANFSACPRQVIAAVRSGTPGVHRPGEDATEQPHG